MRTTRGAGEYLPEMALLARGVGMAASMAGTFAYSVWCVTSSCGAAPFEMRHFGLHHVPVAALSVALLHGGLVASVLAERAGWAARVGSVLLMLPSLLAAALVTDGIVLDPNVHDGGAAAVLVTLLVLLHAIQMARLVRPRPLYHIRALGGA